MDFIKEYFGVMVRFAITILFLGVMIWWLLDVQEYVSSEKVVVTVTEGEKTTTTTEDPFVNSKSILLALIPIFTTMVGYWFGAAGSGRAEKKATEAEKKAAEASTRMEAVIATAPPDLMSQAQKKYPTAFQTGPK